jgi:ubiquinone/menaquinone biosynthesis C-methylase UbiE
MLRRLVRRRNCRQRLGTRVVVGGLLIAAIVAVVLVGLLAVSLGPPRDREVARLIDVLELQEGMAVGEIGAGAATLTIAVARRVGPSGHVFSTELDADRLDQIRAAVGEAGLSNVTVLEAGERSSNLESACCDVILMRRVYHHLSDPAAIVADLKRALKPAGRLAIIEFESSGVLGIVSRAGIDRADLTSQMREGGFALMTADEWPGWDHYIAVFRATR